MPSTNTPTRASSSPTAPNAPAIVAEPTIALPRTDAAPAAYADVSAISFGHWNRLDQGALVAKTSYVDWALLMKRTWGLDVLQCPRCKKRLRVLATITEPDAIRRILECVKLPSKPPPRAPARNSSWEQQGIEFERHSATSR